MATQLTEHFTLEELIHSNTAIAHGIDNTPDGDSAGNLQYLSTMVLEPARMLLDKPMLINDGYRCPEVNKLDGGVPTSQHQSGCAADFQVEGMTPKEVVAIIRHLPIYDQLIAEYLNGEWTHISYNPIGGNRKEVLLATKVDGKTQYSPLEA